MEHSSAAAGAQSLRKNMISVSWWTEPTTALQHKSVHLFHTWRLQSSQSHPRTVSGDVTEVCPEAASDSVSCRWIQDILETSDLIDLHLRPVLISVLEKFIYSSTVLKSVLRNYYFTEDLNFLLLSTCTPLHAGGKECVLIHTWTTQMVYSCQSWMVTSIAFVHVELQ